jgi:NADPH:quinone reductase-like Zn-dependent oxidoreductase
MSLPSEMSGVVLKGHGGPEKLVWRDDLPVPKPRARDVVIRVRSAGVNNTDINTRIAWYSKSGADADDASWSGKPLSFPRIQGANVCGCIVAVGNQVDPARIGERILIEPCIREADGETLETPRYFGSECDGGFAVFLQWRRAHLRRFSRLLARTSASSSGSLRSLRASSR